MLNTKRMNTRVPLGYTIDSPVPFVVSPLIADINICDNGLCQPLPLPFELSFCFLLCCGRVPFAYGVAPAIQYDGGRGVARDFLLFWRCAIRVLYLILLYFISDRVSFRQFQTLRHS